MISIKITYDNSDTTNTQINASLEQAKAYYIGNTFNLGNGENDLLVKAIKVELL